MQVTSRVLTGRDTGMIAADEAGEGCGTTMAVMELPSLGTAAHPVRGAAGGPGGAIAGRCHLVLDRAPLYVQTGRQTRLSVRPSEAEAPRDVANGLGRGPAAADGAQDL